MKFVFLFVAILIVQSAIGQTSPSSVDSLKAEVLSMKEDIKVIQVNLATSEKKFKRGIFVATLGYSITITGGLMLGRKNDELGKALLIAGGGTGVVGTVLMVDSFKYLGRAGRRR
jgi:hypothetical protein